MRKTKHVKACHFAEKDRNIFSYSKIIRIPVEIIELENNSFHMIVKAELDGIKGDMIIDTGASVTVIDQKTFPEKETEENCTHLKSGSVTGQIQDVKVIRIEKFKIGNRRIRNLQVAAIDLDYVNEMYDEHLQRKIIGLLGSDFCVRFGVLIDYQHKMLTMQL